MNRSERSFSVAFSPISNAARTSVIEADQLHHIIRRAFP